VVKKIILILLVFSIYNSLYATKVSRVIDGDTFEIETGEKIRLIGINAPEISDIFGLESKDYLKKLIEGKDVELKDDNISNKTDRYNRLLKYVFLNGEDINNKLILNGYAIAYLKYKFEKSELYKNSQISATTNGLGMWNNKTSNLISVNKTNQINNDNKILSISFKNKILIISIILLLIIGLFSYYRK
jgi:micrococcal nuclease